MTQAPSMTTPERLVNSVQILLGGGNKYSLTPSTRTATSQATSKNKATSKAPMRWRSHSVPRPRALAGTVVAFSALGSIMAGW